MVVNTKDGKNYKQFINHNPADMLTPWKVNNLFSLIIVCHLVTFMWGIVGNWINISTFYRYRHTRSTTYLFMVCLSIADLVLVMICIPVEIIHYVFNGWYKSGLLRKLSSYVEILAAMDSVYSMTAISIERYLVIIYPMQARSICTYRRCRLASIGMFLLSLLLAIPVTFVKDTYMITYYNNANSTTNVFYCNDIDDEEDNTNTPLVSMSLIVPIYHLVTILVVPFVIIAYCYTQVIWKLYKSTKTMSAMASGRSVVRKLRFSEEVQEIPPTRYLSLRMLFCGCRQDQRSFMRRRCNNTAAVIEAKQSREQAVKMLLSIVFMFLICWGPRLIIDIVIKYGLSSFSPALYMLRVIFHLLPFVHSCINPVIYSSMSKTIRQQVLEHYAGTLIGKCLTYLCCETKSHGAVKKNSSATKEIAVGSVLCRGRSVRRHNIVTFDPIEVELQQTHPSDQKVVGHDMQTVVALVEPHSGPQQGEQPSTSFAEESYITQDEQDIEQISYLNPACNDDIIVDFQSDGISDTTCHDSCNISEGNLKCHIDEDQSPADSTSSRIIVQPSNHLISEELFSDNDENQDFSKIYTSNLHAPESSSIIRIEEHTIYDASNESYDAHIIVRNVSEVKNDENQTTYL